MLLSIYHWFDQLINSSFLPWSNIAYMSVPATAKRNVDISMGGIGQFNINVAVSEVALADEDGFVL